MEIDVEALKRDWTGFTFDTAEFEAVTRTWSRLRGLRRVEKRYTDPPSRLPGVRTTLRYVGAESPDSFRGWAVATGSTRASA
jgi:hypothetical protein